jgi:prefoldin subunit 5
VIIFPEHSSSHGLLLLCSWESKFNRSRNHLEQKIPDVKRALDAVRSLERQSLRAEAAGGKPLESHFELSDGLYVRASIPPTKTVCLWLGANVMVEYPFDEAVELLTKNLDAATNNLVGTEADIAYVRDQINTTDVNLSQVYNVRYSHLLSLALVYVYQCLLRVLTLFGCLNPCVGISVGCP